MATENSSTGIRRHLSSGSSFMRTAPWVLLTIGIVCVFIVPLVTLVIMAFRTALPGLDGEWSTGGFVTAFTDSDILKPLVDSLIFAVSSALLGTVLALFFVFIATRTRVRTHRFVTPMMVIILATPVLFFALSWSMLGADRVGLINRIFSLLTGSDESVFSVNSWAGLILVMSMKLSSFSYFLLLGPSMKMNRSLEEASEISGSSRIGSFFRVYLPLMTPSIIGSLLIGFIGSLQAFDTPQIIGTPAGIRVLSTEIFRYVSLYPANYAAAASLAIGLVTLLAGLVWLQTALLKGRDYTTIGGKSTFAAPWSLPRTGWLLNVAVVVFGLLAFVLPTVQLVITSFNTVFGRYDGFSLRNYETLLRNPTVTGALGNTFQLMLIGGFVTVLIGAIITYALRTRPNAWKRLLEMPTWIPWAMPGLVGALSILGTILAIPALHPLYGTLGAMYVALVIAALPTAMRFTESAILQVDRQLVEASRISGAGTTTSFVTVLLPLIAPSFLSGWFVTGLAIAGNLEVPLLLGSTKVTTIAGLAYKYHVDSASPMAAALFCILLVAVAALFAILTVLRRVAAGIIKRRIDLRAATYAAALPAPVVPPAAADDDEPQPDEHVSDDVRAPALH